MRSLSIILLIIFGNSNFAQNKEIMKDQNPLLCNPETGICEMPVNTTPSGNQSEIKSQIKPVKIIYYTDPICSSCWGIEPQLRKLKLEYGNILEIEYRMGGLLPDWSYNSGGISKPSDVAHHWDEVSSYYDMPIDGDVWLEDPLSSSYPPSIAFKAAQIQNVNKAIVFLREIREMVFLQKKNITKWDNIEKAAEKASLDLAQLKYDYEGKAKELFDEDLKTSKELGVRGFPTMFFTNSNGEKVMVYGSKPYNVFENALKDVFPDATKSDFKKDWISIFTKYSSLTAKEFSELSGMSRNEVENYLDQKVHQGLLQKSVIKNGAIWTMKK